MIDGEDGLILRWIVIIHFMLLLQVGIKILQVKWKRWFKMVLLVLNFLWLIGVFWILMMWACSKHFKSLEIWVLCVLSMLKMEILFIWILKNFWKRELQGLKDIIYPDHNQLKLKQFIELLQLLNMLMFHFILFIWCLDNLQNRWWEQEIEDYWYMEKL